MSPAPDRFISALLKAKLLIEGEPDLVDYDVIKFQGRHWLVPMWLEAPSEGLRRPERVILMDTLAHQSLPASAGADFLLNTPIPRSVLLGQIPPELRFVFHVEFQPDVYQSVPKGPSTVQ